MQEILLIVFLIVALALVGVILLQQGKGAGMGASFGAGASGTVFGAPGSGNVLTKITTVLAIIFFAIALALGYLSSGSGEVAKPEDIFDKAAKVEQSEPAAKATATDIPVENAPKSDIPVEQPVVKAQEKVEEVKAEVNQAEKKAEEKKDEKKSDDNGDN